MKEPLKTKTEYGCEIEYYCPKCDAWIATMHLDKDNELIYGTTSSDFIAIGEPCRCCKEEKQ